MIFNIKRRKTKGNKKNIRFEEVTTEGLYSEVE